MNDDLERLRESDEDRRQKEKRQQRGKFKDTLLTTMLGPFRIITDPLLQAINNNRDTFETLNNRTERAEEKYEIYEKSRKELKKLDEEKQADDRLMALTSGAGATPLDKPSIAKAGMGAIRDSFSPKALLADLKSVSGFGEVSFAEYQERNNRLDARDAFVNKIKGLPKAMIKGLFSHEGLSQSGELPPASERTVIDRGRDALEGPVPQVVLGGAGVTNVPLLPSFYEESQAERGSIDALGGKPLPLPPPIAEGVIGEYSVKGELDIYVMILGRCLSTCR